MSSKKITRALISVSNKDGLEELAKALHSKNIEIISTGKTAEFITQLNIPVTKVSDVTNSPEILSGRVKTLHPNIHGAILVDQNNSQHNEEIQKIVGKQFDLVVVNLYQFLDTVSSGANFEDRFEQIDIGGVALIIAAAKNFEHVCV
ncbi:MAG: bifunctional phosphoribosylaminoimidazolecarboxamide formyltransferase/IMP cyclohydrolase, partial [Actinomycetes bacterium]